MRLSSFSLTHWPAATRVRTHVTCARSVLGSPVAAASSSWARRGVVVVFSGHCSRPAVPAANQNSELWTPEEENTSLSGFHTVIAEFWQRWNLVLTNCWTSCSPDSTSDLHFLLYFFFTFDGKSSWCRRGAYTFLHFPTMSRSPPSANWSKRSWGRDGKSARQQWIQGLAGGLLRHKRLWFLCRTST